MSAKRWRQWGLRVAVAGMLALAAFGRMAPQGGPVPARAMQTAARLSGIYADYDSELRETTPRQDGYYHVDTPKLIQKLVQGHISTYAFLIWHARTDWDDFRLEFLPAAQAAGLNVWLYLTPPSEPPSYGTYYPYGSDYVTWAQQAANLAATYPALTALAVDDFDSNESFFTPDYVRRMMAAAHAVAPGLKFLPVDYDLSSARSVPTLTISPAFAAAYQGLLDGVIFPYLHWADKNVLSDEGAQIAANNATLHGKSAQFVVAFPWDRPSAAGDYAALAETITHAGGFPNQPYPFTFRVADDYDGPTSGYHLEQVLVDGRVVWAGDTGGATDVRYVTVNLQQWIAGKTAATITVRVYDAKGVSNYGATVSWDLPPGAWTRSETGAFTGTSAYYPALTGLNVPLIVMIYDGGYGGWAPSLQYLRQANVTAHQAMLHHQAAGIIQYCLDKTDGSTQYPLIQGLYGKWH